LHRGSLFPLEKYLADLGSYFFFFRLVGGAREDPYLG